MHFEIVPPSEASYDDEVLSNYNEKFRQIILKKFVKNHFAASFYSGANRKIEILIVSIVRELLLRRRKRKKTREFNCVDCKRIFITTTKKKEFVKNNFAARKCQI